MFKRWAGLPDVRGVNFGGVGEEMMLSDGRDSRTSGSETVLGWGMMMVS